jgi:hypothetical protein
MTTRTPAPLMSLYNRLRWSLLKPAAPGICRIRHDEQTPNTRGGKYPYLSRFYDQLRKVRGLPETVRYNGERGT